MFCGPNLDLSPNQNVSNRKSRNLAAADSQNSTQWKKTWRKFWNDHREPSGTTSLPGGLRALFQCHYFTLQHHNTIESYTNKTNTTIAPGQLITMNYAEYPLKDIPEPHAHDVLCGRGGGTNNHSKLR